jgi:formylglycine-generating enzyme required for sulfatase activity
VEDCYHLGFEGAPADGSARTTDCSYPDDRVQRGGAFLHEPEDLRSVVRNNWGAGDWANGVGFRIARTF